MSCPIPFLESKRQPCAGSTSFRQKCRKAPAMHGAPLPISLPAALSGIVTAGSTSWFALLGESELCNSHAHGACILVSVIFDRIACATHARGLPLAGSTDFGGTRATHMHTGLTLHPFWLGRILPNQLAHAPKIVRRCVPIRGDEQPASIYRQGSNA